MVESIGELSEVLGIPAGSLYRAAHDVDSYYRKKNLPKKDKLGKPKTKNGRPLTRRIDASSGLLKTIQEAIVEQVLIPMESGWPECVYAGVKGKGAIANANRHRGCHYHFCTDLERFFPSISHRGVKEAFLANGFGCKPASLLTRLVTYKGCVPQGAPTSDRIANLVFEPVDRELMAYAEPCGILYTRYVDDLTFSAQDCFKSQTGEIVAIVLAAGFRINRKKTYYKKGRFPVTGIDVKQNDLAMPDYIGQRLKDPTRSPESKEGIQRYVRGVHNSYRQPRDRARRDT